MPSALVVAALYEETQAFPDEPERFPIAVTGVGKVQASLGLAMAIAIWKPDVVIAVGTAADLRSPLGGPREAGVYRIGNVIQHDYSRIGDILGDTPLADPPESLRVGDSHYTIATGDSFIDDDVRRSMLADEADFVDMESYAYAYVAGRAATPIIILKAVSDTAGENAARTWVESLPECSRQLWLETSKVLDELGV